MPSYRHHDGRILTTTQPHPGCEASPRWKRTDADDSDQSDEAQQVGAPPATSANKPEWVDWAVEHRGLDRDDAEGRTVAQLQDLVDEAG